MIIAIDGPAASGKGTIGKRVAAHYRLRHLDTGLIYRAVAKALLDGGHPLDDAIRAVEAARTLDPTRFDDAALKSHAVGEAASITSAIPEVRAALLAFQRDFAARPPGAVLDGRDIGTVICPEPDVIKFYVYAGVETRARRRAKELQEKGDPAIYPAVLQDMKERDARDANRGIAALRKAPDAFDLDTSNMDADQVFAAALRFIDQKNRATG
jgi:cytidylate kinase